jgi:phosphomannomutase
MIVVTTVILAKLVADVFSANGIEVYLFSELRPTPELSFAVKHLDVNAELYLLHHTILPEYNGYYWQDGGQIVPPKKTKNYHTIENLNFNQIKFEANEDLIHYIRSR